MACPNMADLKEVMVMYNLIFTRSEIKTQKREIDPITGETVLVDIKSNTYDKLPNKINLSVKSIKPHKEGGILNTLEYEVENFYQSIINDSEISKEQESIQKLGNQFKSKLSENQKNILENFIQKVEEIEDKNIFYDDKKTHFAIKYNKGRAKAWVVIRKSGADYLYLWIKINPHTFQDPQKITVPYKDAKAHGNRKLNLTIENIEYIEDILCQTYEFRKRDDYPELYSKVVSDEFYNI